MYCGSFRKFYTAVNRYTVRSNNPVFRHLFAKSTTPRLNRAAQSVARFKPHAVKRLPRPPNTEIKSGVPPSGAIMVTSTMQAAQFTPGGPENLTIGQVPIPELRQNEIMIKVHATAINRADTLQRKGLYPAPAGETAILGLEAAGVVHRVAPGTSRWKQGDRVMALLPGGGNAEYVRAHEDHTMRIPDGMPFTSAAAIPEVWLTAYQLLHLVGQLRSSDVVLIHAGGSGVGTAAVQLVQLVGARALVTAGSQAKINVAKKLGAEQGFNYKEGKFSAKVLEHTQGRGVDLVLDCVGASFWEQNAEVLALDGRWVLYGSMGGSKVEGNLLGVILGKRIQLLGSTLRTRSKEYKTGLVSEFSSNALPHIKDGGLETIIDSVIPFSRLSEAHRKMEANENTGKIVIEVIKDSGTGSHKEL